MVWKVVGHRLFLSTKFEEFQILLDKLRWPWTIMKSWGWGDGHTLWGPPSAVIFGSHGIQWLSSWYWALLLSSCYSLRFKIKVTIGQKIALGNKSYIWQKIIKLCQMNWNIARNNVSVVIYELPSQITIYNCLTIDIWTRRRRRTSTRFYALWCHPPKMASFQWNWHQKILTLLWTPLAHQNALSESYANARSFVLKVQRMTSSPWIF